MNLNTCSFEKLSDLVGKTKEIGTGLLELEGKVAHTDIHI